MEQTQSALSPQTCLQEQTVREHHEKQDTLRRTLLTRLLPLQVGEEEGSQQDETCPGDGLAPPNTVVSVISV